MTINAIDRAAFDRLVNGSQSDKAYLFDTINALVLTTNVTTGVIAPTFQANQHQWYLDTATSKYYRNVDGGITWVALN